MGATVKKKQMPLFMVKSVQYLGQIVDAEGLHTAQDKIKAIEQAPRPRNLQQL